MNKVINCIADYLEVSPVEVRADSHLVNDLGLSSFDLIELSCELEEEFEVELSSDQLCQIEYVKDIKNYLKEKKDEKVKL